MADGEPVIDLFGGWDSMKFRDEHHTRSSVGGLDLLHADVIEKPDVGPQEYDSIVGGRRLLLFPQQEARSFFNRPAPIRDVGHLLCCICHEIARHDLLSELLVDRTCAAINARPPLIPVRCLEAQNVPVLSADQRFWGGPQWWLQEQ